MPTAERSGGSSKEKCPKSDLGNNSAAPQAPATPLLQPVKRQKNDELQPTNDENDEMKKQLGHPSPSTGNQGGRSCAGARVAPAEKFVLGRKC